MANTETFEPSSTTRVRVEELPPKQPTLKVVVPPEPEPEAPRGSATLPAAPGVPDDGATLAALRAIAMILSARAIVFATMAGGFILGAAALVWPDFKRLAVLIAYGVFVIIPAIYLELKRR